MRSRRGPRPSARGCWGAVVAALSATGLLGCAHTAQEDVLMVASFPEDAVAVCFVRQDDGHELGCTAQPRERAADGSVTYDGERIEISASVPVRHVALVRARIDVPRSGELYVRAVAYNSAGASGPSVRAFALGSGIRGIRDPAEKKLAERRER